MNSHADDPHLALHCTDGRRRGVLRAAAHAEGGTAPTGLDDAEAAADRRSVLLYFIGDVPAWLRPHHLQLRGHDAPQVTALDPAPDPDDPQARDCVRVRLDRPGRGCLQLCLVPDTDVVRPEAAAAAADVDPRFGCVDVDFEADCPSDLDCLHDPDCPPPPRDDPEIDYLAKDYASFRRLALERLATVAPDWRDRLVPDLGVTLVELLAYTGDRLSYYQDAVATEAYLGTARRRTSLRRHARLIDYRMHEGCNARTVVHVEVRGAPELDLDDLGFVTGLADVAPMLGPVIGGHVLDDVPETAFERFSPLRLRPASLRAVREEVGGALRWRLHDAGDPVPVQLYEAHNRIELHTWGDQDCCLAEGATAATLVAGPATGGGHDRDEPDDAQPPDDLAAEAAATDTGSTSDGGGPDDVGRLHLAPGDLLLFEEVLGPRTGLPADADPRTRHVVTLTAVHQTRDPLLGTPLVEVAWDPADALPFPLCLSATTADCRELTGVTVARGNLIPVDHGHEVPDEDLGVVPDGPRHYDCVCGRPGDVHTSPARVRPRLERGPVTHAEPVTDGAPAAVLLRQDPRRALPQLRLVDVDDADGDAPEARPGTPGSWQPRADLLAAAPDDRYVVVEPDHDGIATLRFGDGELGARPRVGRRLLTRYRVGNGPRGNVAAEALVHLVYDRHRPDGVVAVRNPLPATGGTAPEALDRVRLLAPHVAAADLRRAVVAEDYAAVTMRDFAARVQRAAAVWRFVGSRDEIQVAVDARGVPEAPEPLLAEIRAHLEPFRRIGHDLRVLAAHQVGLDLAVEVCLAPQASRSDVLAAVHDRLGTGRLPDDSLGRFHPDATTFGEAIRVSHLVAVVAGISGVIRARVTRLRRRLGPEPRDPAARALPLGVLQLGPLELPRCDNDPVRPEHGRLEVDLVGGR